MSIAAGAGVDWRARGLTARERAQAVLAKLVAAGEAIPETWIEPLADAIEAHAVEATGGRVQTPRGTS